MRKWTGLLALGGLALAQASFADPNVALGKTVTLSGTFDSAPPNGLPATVTDGIFLQDGTFYQAGTISWTGTTPVVNIDLGSNFLLSGFQVQADNNDTYSLQYLDASSNFQTAYAVPTQINGGGIATRPVFTLPASINARFLRFLAAGGDNFYSVSEIQAFGVATPAAVPEPGVSDLMASGLFACGGLLARRKRK